MTKKARINRFEAHITPDSKEKLDTLQKSNRLKQGDIVSDLILSITEGDVDAYVS
jgi:chorismate mutase